MSVIKVKRCPFKSKKGCPNDSLDTSSFVFIIRSVFRTQHRNSTWYLQQYQHRGFPKTAAIKHYCSVAFVCSVLLVDNIWKCILEMEELNYCNSGVLLGKQRGKTDYVFMRDFSRFVQGLRTFWQEQRTAKYATHSHKETSVYWPLSLHLKTSLWCHYQPFKSTAGSNIHPWDMNVTRPH